MLLRRKRISRMSHKHWGCRKRPLPGPCGDNRGRIWPDVYKRRNDKNRFSKLTRVIRMLRHFHGKTNMSLKEFAALIALETISIIISLSIMVGIVFFSAVIVGNIYDFLHQIPDPLERGDDLGGGLVVVVWVIIVFFCSIPIFFPLRRYIKRKIYHLFGGNNERN